VDSEESALTTVDINAAIDLRGATNFLVGLIRTNIEGPNGELGISIAEDATTVAAQIRWTNPTNFSFGLVEMKSIYRTYEGCAIDSVGEQQLLRWTTRPSSGGIGDYTVLIPPSLSANEDTTRRGVSPILQAYSASVAELGSGWVEETMVTQLFGAASPVGYIGWSKSMSPGNSQMIADIAELRVRQRRISEIKDVRSSAVRLAQADNNQRQCLSSDLWGTGGCFVESWNSGTGGATPMANPAITPECLTITGKIFFPTPASATTVLRIGDVELQVSTTSTWLLKQGATVVDTLFPVGSFQIALGLRVVGGTASLFVDGALVGSAAFTQGGTGVVIGGSLANLMWRSGSAANGYSDMQMRQVAEALRFLASMPDNWEIDIWAGQSNAVDNSGWQFQGALRADLVGARNVANAGVNNGNHAAGPFVGQPWRNGVPNQWQASPQFSNFIGGTSGWFQAASLAGEPSMLLMCARGGAALSQWADPAGDMRIWTDQAIANAIAKAGTHKVIIGTWIFWQGESDANSDVLASEYGGRLEVVLDWLRTTYNPNIKWVGMLLSTYVTSPYAPEVRQACLDFEAANSNSVRYIPTPSNPADFIDALHFVRWIKPSIGRDAFAARQTL